MAVKNNKTAYLLIGGHEAGKSTSIRGLTGASGRIHKIKITPIKGDDIELFVKISALQELPLRDLWLTPTELLRLLKKYNNCIIALRVYGTDNCPHDAEEYVTQLLNNHWAVKIVYFDYKVKMPQYFNRFNKNIKMNVPDLDTYPQGNVITRDIRHFFNWI